MLSVWVCNHPLSKLICVSYYGSIPLVDSVLRVRALWRSIVGAWFGTLASCIFMSWSGIERCSYAEAMHGKNRHHDRILSACCTVYHNFILSVRMASLHVVYLCPGRWRFLTAFRMQYFSYWRQWYSGAVENPVFVFEGSTPCVHPWSLVGIISTPSVSWAQSPILTAPFLEKKRSQVILNAHKVFPRVLSATFQSISSFFWSSNFDFFLLWRAGIKCWLPARPVHI